MKVAIFHDYFGAIGGGEKVVIAMAKILDADIITTDTDSLMKIDPMVRVRSLGKTLKYPGLKQISAMLKFYFCNFSKEYDFFIFSGNWAHYAAHRHHPNMWYCHTPVRVFYDNYDFFLNALPAYKKPLFQIFAHFFRHLNQKSVRKIDTIIANSSTVHDRVKQYFHRNSQIVFPFVDSSKYCCICYENFWLSINRVYPEKRIDLQIEAFRLMPNQRLVIVGGLAKGDHSSSYYQEIQRTLPENVEILGEVSESDLRDLLARCRGLICTARNEDFGITPLEAMASGKPVIAVPEGGFLETVTNDTGIFAEPDSSKIAEAVLSLHQDPSRYKEDCFTRAKMFDIAIFEQQIRGIVKSQK